MSDFTQIKADVADGVGTITFNRPDRRNALSLELMADLSDCLDDWRRLMPAGQAVSAATELAKSIAGTTTASAMNK